MENYDITIDEYGCATAHTRLGAYVLGVVVYLSPGAKKAFLDFDDMDHLDVAAFAYKARIHKPTDITEN